MSTSVQNAPSAETIGFELEGMWLVSDQITVGLNYSYAGATYDAELLEPTAGTRGVVDGSNALAPSSVFTVAERIPVDLLPDLQEGRLQGALSAFRPVARAVWAPNACSVVYCCVQASKFKLRDGANVLNPQKKVDRETASS